MSSVRTHSTGQSLVEYGLAIALVGLVCVAGIAFFAGELDTTTSNMGTDIAGNGGGLISSGSGAGGGGGSISVGGYNFSKGTPYTGKSVKLTLGSGLEISLDNYPANLAQNVETTGANGATESYMAQLDAIIGAMEANGELPNDQLNKLKKLSNQGHKLADIEKTLEAHMASQTSFPSNPADIAQQELTYEGKTWTLNDLSDRVGFDSGDSTWYEDPIKNMDRKKAGTDLRAFLETYDDIAASGMLSDPAVKAIVDDLTAKVTVIGSSVEGGIEDVHKKGFADPSQGYLELRGKYGGAHTDQYSEGICKVGSGSDSGTHCS